MKSLTLLRQPAVGPLLRSHLCTALGDNALLIVSIALLEEGGAAAWMSPALRICLYLSYVVMAPFAGTLADRLPKRRLVVLVNLAKFAACVLLAAGMHPLLAFGAIGLAGVYYGPAKYGILSELVPQADLVRANAWIEVATVGAILGGAALGAALLQPPAWLPGAHTTARQASLLLASLFGLAALWARTIPATTCVAARTQGALAYFRHQLMALWRDPQGQVSLSVTALFWAAAAILQFLVIRWAEAVLNLSLGGAGLLQCWLAVGVIAGSLGVARYLTAGAALRVLPGGVALGMAIMLLSQVTRLPTACVALSATGVVAGGVMVPMNALLQERGQALMPPGTSIAVQSFSENLASIVGLAGYGLLLTADVKVHTIIIGFGLSITALMLTLMRQRRAPAAMSNERDACP